MNSITLWRLVASQFLSLKSKASSLSFVWEKVDIVFFNHTKFVLTFENSGLFFNYLQFLDKFREKRKVIMEQYNISKPFLNFRVWMISDVYIVLGLNGKNGKGPVIDQGFMKPTGPSNGPHYIQSINHSQCNGGKLLRWSHSWSVLLTKDTATETDRAGIWTRNPQITYVQSMVYSHSPPSEVDGQHKVDSMTYLPQMTVK